MKKVKELFNICEDKKGYIHVDNSGDYKTIIDEDVLYIFLECSNGKEDWENNFDFIPEDREALSFWQKLKMYLRTFIEFITTPQKSYKNSTISWKCHRGFLKVWKSIEPYVKELILDKDVKHIVTVGYSHGAALAVLCHEYVWYNRPDIRDSIYGIGFGCPRVVWMPNKELEERWDKFTVVRVIDDLVTHVPPTAFGFTHVGNILEIGREGKYNCIDAHRPENITKELLWADPKIDDILNN